MHTATQNIFRLCDIQDRYSIYSDVTNDNSGVTNDNSDITNDYNGITNDYNGITNDYSDITNDYSGITNDYSGITNDYSDATVMNMKHHFTANTSSLFQLLLAGDFSCVEWVVS